MSSNLTAIISADTTGFKKSIQDAKNVLNDYTNAAKKSSTEIRNNVSVSNEQVTAYNRVVKALEKVNDGSLSVNRAEKELTNQIRELKIQWANLSDEAKKSDFGKSISSSLNSATKQLDTLKLQINQTTDATKKGNDSSTDYGNSLTGLIGIAKKLAPAIGGVVAIQKTFTEVVNSSQTTSDAFNNTLYAGKNVLKEFASAIATFDFSAFNAGLDSMIQKGYDAAAAIDQLGNTIMSYNVKSAKANQKLSAARAIISDPNSTKAQIAQAKKDMKDALEELKGAASVMMSDYENALITEVNSRGGSLSGEGALTILDKWLEVDTTENRKQIKEAAQKGYDAYLEELSKLNNDTVNIPTKTTFIGGGMFGGSQAITTVNKNSEEYKTRLSELNDKYKDQIAYHVLLEKYSDEELQKLGEQRIAMININGQLDSYTNSMNKLNNKSGGNGSTSPLSNPQSMQGSINQIKNAISEAEKLKNSEVVGTEEWWKQVKALEALNSQLDAALSKENRLKMGEIPPITSLSGPINNKVDGPKLGLTGKNPFEIQMEQMDEWKDHYKDTMEEVAGYSDIIGGISNLFNALGSNMDDNSKSWMQFGASVIQTIAKIIPQILALTEANAIEAGAAGAAAAAESGKSVASIPYVGPIMAVAAIASVVAELIAAFASMPKFADGGIIGGSSSIGDYNLARVNSGEMILNGSQQARLFSMLNNGGLSGGRIETTTKTKIEGSDLLLISKNYMKKMDKI